MLLFESPDLVIIQSPCQKKKKKKAAPSSSYMMKDKPKLNIPEIHYRIPSFRSGIRMGKGVEGVVEGES